MVEVSKAAGRNISMCLAEGHVINSMLSVQLLAFSAEQCVSFVWESTSNRLLDRILGTKKEINTDF